MSETLPQKLERLHAEQRAIESKIRDCYRQSLSMPDDEKACEDWMAETLARPSPKMEYPVTINGIARREAEAFSSHTMREVFSLVAVRPCDKALGGKTFLGIYLGDIASDVSVCLNTKTGVLEVGLGHHNPAIWVPDLKRIVWGCGSWWGPIKSEEQLRQITDEDIQNVWYVKMLKSKFGTGDESATESK